MKYITAKAWYDAKTRRHGETPPIENVRAKCWAVTIPLKDGNMMETLQDLLLKLTADPTFKGHYQAKEGKLHAAISWNTAKTGQWVKKQLAETNAHIEPAIDAQTLTRWVLKS